MTDITKTTKKAPAAKPKPAAKKAAAQVVSETTKLVTAKKTAAKPAPAKKAGVLAPKKSAKPAAAPAGTVREALIITSDEQRYRMIAEAAYFRAEKSQFKSDPVRDWIEAEKDIAAMLGDQ